MCITALKRKQIDVYVCILCFYICTVMQNFTRYQSAQKPFFNDSYRAKYGMNFAGDKIGTYVGAIWVVNGHCNICMIFAAFFMKNNAF